MEGEPTEPEAEVIRFPRGFSLDYAMRLQSLPDNVFNLPVKVEIPDEPA